MPIERVDKLLQAQGLASSRVAAQKLIAQGAVTANEAGYWRAVNKASQKFSSDCEFKVEAIDELKYASRAGLKLEAAFAWMKQAGELATFNFNAALDIGQSTGGFTDCLLRFGAKRVIGVDVGHNQLIERLRCDPRVVCLEGINARNLPDTLFPELMPEGFDVCVMDVSFISQTLILPNLARTIKSGGYLISLIKPQFEVGPEHVQTGGLVQSDAAQAKAVAAVTQCGLDAGLAKIAVLPSPILGGHGNREFLFIARRPFQKI